MKDRYGSNSLLVDRKGRLSETWIKVMKKVILVRALTLDLTFCMIERRNRI